MNVKEIIEKHLKDNGLDGLYHPEEPCGCFLDDLIPCGENADLCIAGYKAPCAGIGECRNDSGCVPGKCFYVKPDKPEAER